MTYGELLRQLQAFDLPDDARIVIFARVGPRRLRRYSLCLSRASQVINMSACAIEAVDPRIEAVDPRG
jgi:hypothetical protein